MALAAPWVGLSGFSGGPQGKSLGTPGLESCTQIWIIYQNVVIYTTNCKYNLIRNVNLSNKDV